MIHTLRKDFCKEIERPQKRKICFFFVAFFTRMAFVRSSNFISWLKAASGNQSMTLLNNFPTTMTIICLIGRHRYAVIALILKLKSGRTDQEIKRLKSIPKTFSGRCWLTWNAVRFNRICSACMTLVSWTFTGIYTANVTSTWFQGFASFSDL